MPSSTEKAPPPAEPVDWHADEYWRRRKLSPAQLLIHDVRIDDWAQTSAGAGDSRSRAPWLEISETMSSSLAPALAARHRLAETIAAGAGAPDELVAGAISRQERSQLRALADEYGWINCLRSAGVQEHPEDPLDLRKCRWIHISSKYPEYIHGCLLALSDWSNPNAANSVLSSLRLLEQCIHQHERFSKHGRYFTPFCESLSHSTSAQNDGPLLISIPFLDWSVEGPPPPLRFQIDRREGYQSSRTTAHAIRSILQHFYRLEDTSDRETNQVFTKFKPWLNDHQLDLKVRRWYGTYPSALNVDELWVLVVDSRHIVTFSSNQSWKSRWPPLQLSSRIAEVSFRGIRNSILVSDRRADYTSYTHAIATLSGAVGILHRSFWTDLPLCLSDRFAGYLSHLQYRLLRSPSAKLVMDLLQVQEELNIIIQITQQQVDLVNTVQSAWNVRGVELVSRAHSTASGSCDRPSMPRIISHPGRSTFRQYSSSALADPIQQLLENLQRELIDLTELRDNANALANRTIQLVNIRLEDHGKAILVFTIVTIVFLPLSFVTSFFGMNTKDIRNMESGQGLFWIIACILTTLIVAMALFLAFYGGEIVEKVIFWKESKKRAPSFFSRKAKSQSFESSKSPIPAKSFEVLDVR